MAWGTEPSPSPSAYPSPNPFYVGNALANLVSNYQQAQQGQQATQQNNLRLQQDQQLLDQSKAFAGGVPTNPDGTTNYSAIMNTLAEKGDINAISQFAPLIQNQQWQNAAASDSGFGGSSGGGGGSAGAGANVSPPASGPWSGNPFLSTLVGAESEGNDNAVGDGGQAKGDFQFHDATWQKYAKNVPGASQYAEAEDAPPAVQQAVAETAPISEWGPRTKEILHAKFGNFDDSQTIGQLAAEFGGGKGGGTQVASAGASDAPAYASPDTPAIPPVSAAAGSSIPSANAETTPSPAGGPLAANNPAWAGLNASLPVGPSGAPAQVPAAPAPRAPAPPPQGSVASLASPAGLNPTVTANVAKAVGVPPGAPLNPQQALRAKAIIQGIVQRAQQSGQQQQAPQPVQQQPQGGQAQPSQGGQPIIPQFQLPPGAKNPQDGILMLDKRIADIARSGNPYLMKQIPAFEDWRDRIAKASAPMEVHPGTSFVDPVTGQTRFQAPAAATARMEAMQGRADDVAESIKTGDQPPVLTGLYGMGPLVRSALSKDGFDLSKAQLQWDAAKKQVQSLNGPQMVRFKGLADSVVNTIDEVSALADQMQNSGIPLLNKAKLQAYIQAEGNSENGQIATRYMTAVGTLKEEFANLANGGYAPTEPAWKLADQQINGNYGVKQLGASLTEIQRLIKYRLNAMPGMASVGPGAANPYFPGGGQAPNAPAAGQGQPQGGGAHPPGNYNYDPATGHLEPVK
jgi:hypothetical protein